MNFEEFKFLINRITILSDRCSGLKTQNKILEKRINKIKNENIKLLANNEALAKKVTELNHELQKYQKEHETPNGFHGKINIKEMKNNE